MAQISKLIDLVLAYPNFQLGQIIDPEQANLNNLQITNKINLLIKELNKISGNDASEKGASFISVTPLPEIPTATDVETLITQMWNYLKASTGGSVIGVTKLDGTTGTLQSALSELKTNLETNITQKFNALGVRIDEVEADLLEMSTRFSQNEELIFQNALDIADLQDKTDETNAKVASNTSSIVTAQSDIVALDGRTQDLESYASSSVVRIQDLETLVETALEVSPNAELADARSSSANSKTYSNLDERLEAIEVSVKNIDFPEIVYPVTSVNGQTGDVTIVDAVTSVNGQTGNVTIPIPVTSVAGKTGAVTLAKADVGLGSVENLPLATTAQAQAGVSNAVYMTPLRVAEAIASKALPNPGYGGTHELGQFLDFHSAGSTADYNARICYEPLNGYLYFVDAGGNMPISFEINNLKSTVVSGKTSVANAINGKLGTTLSNQNTFAEYANAISSIGTSSVFVQNDLFYSTSNRLTTTAKNLIFIGVGSSSEGYFGINIKSSVASAFTFTAYDFRYSPSGANRILTSEVALTTDFKALSGNYVLIMKNPNSYEITVYNNNSTCASLQLLTI